MQLPDANNWETDWEGPAPEQPAPDYMARAFADICRRVEELEDLLASQQSH